MSLGAVRLLAERVNKTILQRGSVPAERLVVGVPLELEGHARMCGELNESVRFYSAISQRGAAPGIDHIGIRVETNAELAEMNARFAVAELPVQRQIGATCCYAKSDKAWTVDPQGVVWETFRTLEGVPTYGQSRNAPANKSSAECCAR